MAGPNPIVINFLTQGLDKVLKDMKSIQDAVLGVEHKSTAAAKAGLSDRQKAREKEKDQAVKAAKNTSDQLVAAQKAGTKGLAKELATSLQNQRRHIEQLKKAEDAHTNYARKLRDQHFANLHKAEQAGAKRSQSNEAAHLNYQRKLREQHFANLHKAEKQAAEKSRANAKRAERDAQSRQDFSVDVAKKLKVAERRAHFDAKRGFEGAPEFSPVARLHLLRGAKFKSPEEQLKALEKEADMREEGKISSKRRAEINALADAKGRAERAQDKKTQRERERDEKRAANEKRREDRRIEKEKERETKRVNREIEREKEQRQATFNRVSGNVAAGVGGIVQRTAAGAFNTVTNLGGGFDLQTALQDKINVEKQAGLLSVASRAPGMRPATKSQILSDARSISVATGMDQTDVIEGLNQFTAKTGNYDAAARNAKFFGKVSKATGTSLKDVMSTAGIMTVQNKELGKGALGEAALQKLILASVMQARQGSVEFEDLAKAGGMITRTSSAYAGNQDDNQRKLLGLSQIGVRTGGRAQVAATDLSNLVSDSTTHKAEVEQLLGKKFKDDRGRIIGGPDQFIGDLMEAAMGRKGGLDNLSNAGGDGKRVFGQRSMRFFQALAPVYNEAQAQALAGGASEADAKKAGAAAVRKDIATSIQTNYSKEQMEQEFSEVMKSSAEKFEGAVRELKVGIADQLLPQLVQLIPVLKALTPVLVSLVAFLGKLTGTDIGNRATTGAEATINAANALGDLRTGKITPDQAREIQAQLGKNTAEREAGSKDKTGRIFDAVTASFIDLATLGFAGQTKKLGEERSVADPSEKKAIEEQKALYELLGKQISAMTTASATAAAELNKIKAPGTPAGGPAPPAVPTAPVARR